MEKLFKVRAFEEEVGYNYLLISVPNYTNDEEVYKDFEMASKYATMDTCMSEEEGIAEYDIYYLDMADFKETNNGLITFVYYLKDKCSYEVQTFKPNYDYEFEW